MEPIIPGLFVLALGFVLNWLKKKCGYCVALVFILLCLLIVPTYWAYKLHLNITQLKEEVDECGSEKKACQDRLSTLGDSDTSEDYLSTRDRDLVIQDFLRDWDIGDYFLRNSDEFCPRSSGRNNFQRMFYKPGVALVGSWLEIKYNVVDRNTGQIDYKQRVVVGLGTRDNFISEVDFQTRGGQEVNYRQATTSGQLVSSRSGDQLSSPIKEGTAISMKYSTQSNHGREFTEVLQMDYLSSISEYGEDSYDGSGPVTLMNDSNPETASSSFYFGNYIGACIKIQDYRVVSGRDR